MTVHRTLAVRTAVLAGGLALIATPAIPASAHGATTDPVSRAAACGPEGGDRQRSAACRAAVEANAGQAFTAWDNVRVPNVAGRDRQRIPDGKLCSAGLPEFRGLDLPRTDWPSTRLTPGAGHTFRYRSTIGHRGTFRLYATRAGYDPGRVLRWADLDPKPFLTVVDPQLRDGSYQLKGRLPAGRSGRHLIYAIWQNSDTPDTYYSCSDVQFAVAAAGAAGSGAAAPGAAAPAPGAEGSGSAGAGAAAPAAPAAPGVPDAAAGNNAGSAGGKPADTRPEPNTKWRAVPAQDGHGPLVVAGMAAGVAVLTAFLAIRRARRQRRSA